MKTVEDILEHHGVKGQKWGVRHDPGHEGQRAKTSKISRLDKKFVRKSQDPRTTITIWNKAADANNASIQKINNKPQYRGKDFTRQSPLRDRYHKEIQSAMVDNLETAAKSLGTSASGTLRYGILEKTDNSWDVIVRDVKHADDSSNTVLSITVNRDANGMITSVNASAAHSSMVDEFLEHHGVKGQKWGIRNKRSRVKTSRPPSADSRKISELKKKHPSQLTNKQLKSVQERHNLERSFKQANPAKVEQGHAFAKSVLALTSTAAAFFALAQSPAGKALIKAGQGFINVHFSARPAGTTKIDLSRYRYSTQGKLF